MLNRKLSEARITFDLKTTSSLLIKQGEHNDAKSRRQERLNEGKEHTLRGADMIFIYLGKDAEENRFYIPGSSIKGVMRSWCEKITRTLVANKCCDPFEDKQAETLSCSEKFSRLLSQDGRGARRTLETYSEEERLSEELQLNGRLAYHFSCPICKLFGCSVLASRLKTNDAYPIIPNHKDAKSYLQEHLVKRDSIAIDRFTGGVKDGAKFDYQALQGVKFRVTVEIQNFELWQLGLLGFYFRDLQQGEVSIGYGKTRGLGGVTCENASVTLSYIGNSSDITLDKAQGIGSLLRDDELAKKYGLVLNDSLTGLSNTHQKSEPRRLWQTFTYKAQQGNQPLNDFFVKCSQKWVGNAPPNYIDDYNTDSEVGDAVMLKARKVLMDSSNFKSEEAESSNGKN